MPASITSTGRFKWAVASLSGVERLGSNVDLSPSIDRLMKVFGRRLAIIPSAECSSLMRYRFDRARRDGITIADNLEKLDALRKKTENGGKNVLGIPFGDDTEALVVSYQALDSSSPLDSFRINFGNHARCLEHHSNDEESSFTTDRGGALFDETIEAAGLPFILKNMEVVKLAERLDGKTGYDTSDIRPMIWTTQKEKDAAAGIFALTKFLPERTIGLHLTAGSYKVFDQVWPASSFHEVADHFLKKNYNILFICGSLFGHIPENMMDDNQRYSHLAALSNKEIHEKFLAELSDRHRAIKGNKPFGLFFGDVLEEAEVIRMCRSFLSIDTGPSHLASTVGTPKVTIAHDWLQKLVWVRTTGQDKSLVARIDGNKVIGPGPVDVIVAMEEVLHR
ncbi:MAG: hypothetical protein NTZ10_03325 [Candidatus Saganbacteria bacterium]|nr:hypothetical protein [Candidatus Saganbacteria bacterium]